MLKNFKRDFLIKELDLPYNDELVVEDHVVDKTRWSVIHKLIFKFEDKFYQTTYSVGATEYQDESPWEYEKEVPCVEVRQVPKTVMVWEPVDKEN